MNEITTDLLKQKTDEPMSMINNEKIVAEAVKQSDLYISADEILVLSVKLSFPLCGFCVLPTSMPVVSLQFIVFV